LPKAQNRAVQNHQPTRLTLKARPRGKSKSSGAPAHVQPLVAIKNDTGIRVLIMSPMPSEGTAGDRVPRSSRGCVRYEQSQHQCCGTTKTPCHRGLLAILLSALKMLIESNENINQGSRRRIVGETLSAFTLKGSSHRDETDDYAAFIV
jgi:hypothetical protein